MKAVFLRSVSLFLLFCILATGLYAQQNRFLYIQTENKQSFYVKMNNRILSSSVSGYIIIAGLTDSAYTVSLGFPKDEWPEQNVTITVKEADAGYLLKNLGQKGWGLFNLQTTQVLMPVKNKNVAETETMSDEFSIMLASVVNDPRIAQRIIMKADTAAAERSPVISSEAKPLVKEEVKPVLNKAGIVKLKYDIDPAGINMAYQDISNGITDTVKLFIPAAALMDTQGLVKRSERPKQVKVKDGSNNKDARFIDMELQNPNARPDTTKAADQVIREKKSSSGGSAKNVMDSSGKEINHAASNAKCKNVASYDDFINLRRLMAAEENYENMISLARKKFRSTCYTTEQVKNLGSMFLNDEGKYKFYAVAYPFVSDAQNFGILENQLADKSFITKFRAILH